MMRNWQQFRIKFRRAEVVLIVLKKLFFIRKVLCTLDKYRSPSFLLMDHNWYFYNIIELVDFIILYTLFLCHIFLNQCMSICSSQIFNSFPKSALYILINPILCRCTATQAYPAAFLMLVCFLLQSCWSIGAVLHQHFHDLHIYSFCWSSQRCFSLLLILPFFCSIYALSILFLFPE